MASKAQVGLEYLMTYGWILIVVASILGVLVFIMNPLSAEAVFSSSDPAKFLLKGTSVSGNSLGLVLQNATGGKITIKSIALSGDIGVASGTKLDGAAWPAFPVDVVTGGEIRIEGLNASNGAANSRVSIQYVDAFNFDREVNITSGVGGPAGIVAKYSFEEGSGPSTADGSGNWHNGTITGATSQTTGCLSGKCLSFDGAGDYVDVGTISLNQFSASVWINPNSPNNWSRPMDSSGVWTIIKHSDGRYYFIVTNTIGTSYNTWNSATQVTPNGAWEHFVATFDGSKLRWYQNGTFRSSQSFFGTIHATTGPTRIGWNNWKGLIDEVQVFNRALTAGEICNECKRYAAGAGSTCNC